MRPQLKTYLTQKARAVKLPLKCMPASLLSLFQPSSTVADNDKYQIEVSTSEASEGDLPREFEPQKHTKQVLRYETKETQELVEKLVEKQAALAALSSSLLLTFVRKLDESHDMYECSPTGAAVPAGPAPPSSSGQIPRRPAMSLGSGLLAVARRGCHPLLAGKFLFSFRALAV